MQILDTIEEVEKFGDTRPGVFPVGVHTVERSNVKLIENDLIEGRRFETRVMPGIVGRIAQKTIAIVQRLAGVEFSRVGIPLEPGGAMTPHPESIRRAVGEAEIRSTCRRAGGQGTMHQAAASHGHAGIGEIAAGDEAAASALGAQARNVAPPDTRFPPIGVDGVMFCWEAGMFPPRCTYRPRLLADYAGDPCRCAFQRALPYSPRSTSPEMPSPDAEPVKV